MDNVEKVLNQELEEKGHEEMNKVGCIAVAYQDVNVSVPVTIKPFGEVGNAKTRCIGKAVISPGCDIHFQKPEEVCKFTISQKLCVEVPVVFGARAEAGKAAVDCDCEKYPKEN